jgi:DNA invertase Pin-like site-specific DNA recombinase
LRGVKVAVRAVPQEAEPTGYLRSQEWTLSPNPFGLCCIVARVPTTRAGRSVNNRCAKEVVLRERVVIVKEFADQSVSGWDTARRSGFAAVLAFCQEQARLGNPIEAVVCYHANRFSRSDGLETSRFLCEFRDAGATRMLTATRWINFNSPEDRMQFGLEQEVSSHRYGTDLSKVTIRGKRAAAAKGLWLGGKPPFAPRSPDRSGSPNPIRA